MDIFWKTYKASETEHIQNLFNLSPKLPGSCPESLPLQRTNKYKENKQVLSVLKPSTINVTHGPLLLKTLHYFNLVLLFLLNETKWPKNCAMDILQFWLYMLRRVLNQKDINIFQRVSQSKTKITQKLLIYHCLFFCIPLCIIPVKLNKTNDNKTTEQNHGNHKSVSIKNVSVALNY